MSAFDESTIRRWDSIARDPGLRNEFLAGIGSADAPSRRLIAQAIGDREPVLDVGCGPGVFLDTIGPRRGYVGIDTSAEMIDLAASRHPPADWPLARFVCGPIETLEPGRSSQWPHVWPAVVVRHVLEHLDRPEPLLTACAGLCAAAGGVLAIAFSHWTTDTLPPHGFTRIVDTELRVPRYAHLRSRLERELAGWTIERTAYDPRKPDQLVLPREEVWICRRDSEFARDVRAEVERCTPKA